MSTDQRLDLFLADADERRPVLGDGLPRDTLQRAQRPRAPKDRDAIPDKHRSDADPNALPEQRWAVIAVEGREGDRQLEAIQPLVRLREQEQGAPATIYRVRAEMNAREALAWKNEVHAAENVPEAERPHYLLMLGDLDQTSLELQQVLAHRSLVGRVHAGNAEGETDLAGYAAYADKVVRHAGAAATAGGPGLLYFVADDKTSATASGKARLVEPSLAESERQLAKGSLPVASVDEIEARSVTRLLEAGAGTRPSVLLTVSHGVGAPRRGWGSEAQQRMRQGAMVIAPDEVLDAERMRGQAFLPGGMWFFLACFGAGTPGPATSVYHAWLSDLAREEAYGGDLESVLRSLPRPEWRPFIAALPQAALASPEGPLAIISHVDLAWSYGFSGTNDLSESRKSRILEPLHVLARGSRAGVALGKLMEPYREANDALTSMYQVQKDAQVNGRPDPTDARERGNLWMLRNDLRGYVLLGDPAARLPLGQGAPRQAERALVAVEIGAAPAPVEIGAAPAPVVVGPAPAPVEVFQAPPPVEVRPAPAPVEVRPAPAPVEVFQAPAPPSPMAGLETREAAVIETLAGDEAPRRIAERAGVSLATLWEWVHAYRTGGRARLG